MHQICVIQKHSFEFCYLFVETCFRFKTHNLFVERSASISGAPTKREEPENEENQLLSIIQQLRDEQSRTRWRDLMILMGRYVGVRHHNKVRQVCR